MNKSSNDDEEDDGEDEDNEISSAVANSSDNKAIVQLETIEENEVVEITNEIASVEISDVASFDTAFTKVASLEEELPAVIMPLSPAASPKKGLDNTESIFLSSNSNKPSFDIVQPPAAPIPTQSLFGVSPQLSSAPPQQLVNFLLGKDSSPPPGFSLPSKPLASTSLSHHSNPFPVQSTPAPPGFSTTVSTGSRLPYASQYFPTSTAVNDAVFMATGVNLQHPHSSLGLTAPPPGLSPNGANKNNNSFQPTATASTRPVAPVGPPAVPTAPVYSSIDLRTQREPVSTTVISTASTTTPTSNNSANSNYYKSKSGISVRL